MQSMENKNKYASMTESQAMYKCKEEVSDLIFDLIDAQGSYCAKEVLTSVLDTLIENGYF